MCCSQPVSSQQAKNPFIIIVFNSSSPSSQSLHTLQPADIMKNDLINPIRLEFQTNQLSFQRGPSGPNIQPHTTAVHHDRGGQIHAKRAELNLIC